MNAVVLLSLICLWYLKITSLPKLFYFLCTIQIVAVLAKMYQNKLF